MLLHKFTKAAVTITILSMVATSVSAGVFINEIGNVPCSIVNFCFICPMTRSVHELFGGTF